LVGPNGAGKTTLLKMILGELQPDPGVVNLGTNLQVAYFDQFREQLDENATVIDTISQGNDFIEIGNQRKHVISYLEEFLFAPARARSPVSSLSGGERNRLLLARLFTRPANVLVLDEPTNDLDIDTLELLEELLSGYSGTVFLVSHDRAFLDNVVTQVIAFEANGVLIENAGGYADWMEAKARMASLAPVAPVAAPKANTQAQAKPSEPVKAKKKLSFNDARLLEQLPLQISALEAEKLDIQQQLLDASIYRNGPKLAQDMQRRIDELDGLILEKMNTWEELDAKA
jgi:ATP-binding cassette subfamily F protein uup